MDEAKLQTAAQNTPRAGHTGAEEDRRRADMQEFAEMFPEVAQDPQSIPQEVWDEVRRGRSLVGAYARYLLTRRESEDRHRRETDRWNADTAARSTGSMRSAESGLSGRDAFLQGFLD